MRLSRSLLLALSTLTGLAVSLGSPRGGLFFKHSTQYRHRRVLGATATFSGPIPTSLPAVVKQPTVGSLSQGVVQVLRQFHGLAYIPGGIVKPLAGALSKAISGQLRVPYQQGSPCTCTADNTAALDIQTAINEAFAAVGLAQGDLTNSTIAELEACLSTVLSAGGLPAGYKCLSSSGTSSAGLLSTLDTVLQQFVGILPNVILNETFSAVSTSIGALLPASDAALVVQIEASITSVIATLSASSSQALIQAGACYTEAIQKAGNVSSINCFDQTALQTMETAQTAVIENFVGVLPGELITSVENIIGYTLSNGSHTPVQDLAAQVQAQISNAITSAGNTLTGNTVSEALVLQACATQLILTGNATAAKACVTSNNTLSFSNTIVLGIAEQFKGYLPSSFFTDLVDAASPLISNLTANPSQASLATISSALSAFFNRKSRYGPAYVGCLIQVEDCVLNAVHISGNVTSVCPGPIAGCKLRRNHHARFAKREGGEGAARGQWEHLIWEMQRLSEIFSDEGGQTGRASGGLLEWEMKDFVVAEKFLRHFETRSGRSD